MIRVKQLVIIGFSSAVVAAILAYYVVIPSLYTHANNQRMVEAENILNQAHSKSKILDNVIVADVGPQQVTGEEVYMLTVENQSGMRAAENAMSKPSVAQLTASYRNLTGLMAASQWITSHQNIHMSTSAIHNFEALQLTSIRSSAVANNWSTAMLLARAKHPTWESTHYWAAEAIFTDAVQKDKAVTRELNSNLLAISGSIHPEQSLSTVVKLILSSR